MDSKRSTADQGVTADDWQGRTIDLAEFGSDLLRRRAELRETLGEVPTPRNADANRTPSKRALLAASKAAGGEW